MRPINRNFLFFSIAILWQSLTALSASAQITKISDGIQITAGDNYISILAINGSAFCIGVSKAPAAQINSVFIEKAKAATPYTVVSATPFYGIKTAYGKLLVNTKTQTWQLYGAAGSVLINNGSFSVADGEVQITTPSKGLLYGSGNKSTKNLEKTGSSSTTGNGITDVPYFWSSAGFSSLGVSVNDNKPATWKQDKNSNNIIWTFAGKAGNLYLWPAKNLYNAASGYVKLTGKPKLPPKWALGYLQSQWGWTDSAYIANVAHEFRSRKLPVDAFIIDFEWYTGFPDYFMKKEGSDGFNDFGFSPKLFPHPAKQLTDLKNEGIHFIGIRKPRLGNKLFLDTVRKNGWLNSPDNPDADRDLNFNNAGLRKWYGKKSKPLLDAGVETWWNDEGESYYTCYYGWNTAQNDLLASARPNQRFFTLNRAFSPGNQRFGYCTWTGDILSTWSSLNDVPKDLLNFSLAGMYYGSCDIGGFSGSHDSPVTKEMLVRWFQAGVFFPVMRSHSNIETTPHFPYAWGPDAEVAMRKALNLRYRLLPYIYSLGHEAYQTGAPIMRPLIMEFATDTTVANKTDEWLLGKDILAAPLLNEGGKRKIYLPADTWYDNETGRAFKGPMTISVDKALDEVPVYIRAGAIIPLGPVVQYTGQNTGMALELHVYPGKNGNFNMVEDDGSTYNYTKGNIRTTAFRWDDKTKTLSWKATGPYTGNNVYKTVKIITGKAIKTAKLTQNGKVQF
ncbi:DUF5110 domain-containing protein [Mucilaginibacter conchicola]|uniref:DUF5110 domain-containing protein n=1 Tax=Mucilaginibacter conchicola TaxID=2303333 RepID=A0A372NMD7_9SPHI|nr:TIM-barrel domain-containing protein [Mucilaginibacter conchicola]RFZ90122.1 DUF5110 domain-containing protein [Mucilaginibacter conchicola]